MIQTGAGTTTQAETDATLGKHRTVLTEDMVRKRKKSTMAEEELSRLPYSKSKIIWSNVLYIVILHGLAVRGLFYLPTAKYQTIIFAYIVAGIGGFGVTGGVHRYFTHRSFKAKIPLQILLLACYTVSGQNTVPDWVRDHRVHHKFSETNADPHNASRGFFFSHVGWLMQRKHPEVSKRGRTVDMSDITNDPVIRFHTKYFTLLKLLLCFILPIAIPVLAWTENFIVSVFVAGFLRYVYNLNVTWSVNSVAHIWGHKPYDKRIQPVQNLIVSVLSLGEGWHNYHHVFPWDYRAAEIGGYLLNTTTMWLDFFAGLGWAYDLKTPSEHLVQQVAVNHGDGSWQVSDNTGSYNTGK
ncbi:Acyl-CoA desaturase,Fatty acid desaturase domain [Cinara cedri]|uniref:Acyl-CoA desaturase,Fatty acid desaturase domain n=1 Tax=Cinara cedri TaxID=506608 RepID=A0A5E4N2Y3_9HEMI|nr:Acyl-CoA desaturase,Fatty acid desaturase domain [Cinara cedri]